MPEGVAGSEAFCAHGGSRRSRIEKRGAPGLAGSERVEPDFLQDLPSEMTKFE
jgi:hypothetical protein